VDTTSPHNIPGLYPPNDNGKERLINWRRLRGRNSGTQ
jgi:hypothetical protein